MGKRSTKSSKSASKRASRNAKATIASQSAKTNKVVVKVHNSINQHVAISGKDSKLMAKKAKGMEVMTRKERANIEFDSNNQMTHKVVVGPYKDFTGSFTSVNKNVPVNGIAEFQLFANARGKPVYQAKTILVNASYVQQLTSDEMLDFANHIGGEEEDQALIQAESLFWTCPKCSAKVPNDHGNCPEIVNGKACLRMRDAPQKFLGWANCFASVAGTAFVSADIVVCEHCRVKNPVASAACVACAQSLRVTPAVVKKNGMEDSAKADGSPTVGADN